MRRKNSPLFVLADGGRARLVERCVETGDFRTLEELDGSRDLARIRARQQAHPSVRSVQSISGAGHTTGQDDPYGPAKARFVEEVMAAACARARGRADPALVLVAPARLLSHMAARPEAAELVRGRISKDLTKTPDHELGEWLDRVAWN